MAFVDALHRSLENHSMWDICTEVVLFLGAVCIAFLVGLVVGWEWKPKWASFSTDKLAYRVMKLLDSSLPSSPRWSRMPSFKSPAGASLVDPPVDKNPPSTSPSEFGDCSTSELNEEQQSNIVGLLTVEDLEHLYKLVEVKDGGPTWIHMMDRSTPGMSYQAWRRDPKNGPPQYRSRTVFEDASPEIVRDLFWDDEFRKHWDDMLASFNILDECPTTGTMLVQWIRKFPFFCSDREYIIGRRIWESGRSYYCVTKGASGSSSLPRRDKPRRVDLYYSSWFIRAVESRRGDGQLTACEVLLYHHEDMGIPWEIAKLGVRQGMWGTVKKIEPGLRAYQKARASGAPLSRSAFMAQINTKVNLELLRSLGSLGDGSSESESVDPSESPPGPNIAKFLIIGGAVVLACSIDRGLLTKTFIFGVGRRFANIGKMVRVQ